jgi:alpha-N-arabinofuranosidase
MARVTRCNEGKGWLRRMWVAVGVSAAVIGLTTPASAAADQPVIIVRHERAVTVDGRSVGPVPAGIVGANHRWPNDGLGMWDPTTNSPVDGIDALSRQIGLHTVRHPGGTVANLFDFTKAIGPHNQRGCQTSGGFAVGLFAPTDSRYGPDENEKYVEAIGGETMVMVPTINRTAADAADYVEYMNSPADGVLSNPNGGLDWGDIRAQNGHPSPYGIHIWEFGNEPYLANQRYWRASDTATKVAQFIEGGWQRQTASDPQYADNDGLFLGCDLATRRAGTGEPGQTYRVRFAPIALPGDEHGAAGVGDAPVTEPLLTVAGESWRRVDDLSTQPPEAKVYAIDQAEGLVHFGDGVRGAVPPAGARLSIEYTSGVHEGYLAFRAAMKAVDPTIQVCAGWGKPEFVDAMGSRPYDCLGVHSYSTPPDDGTLTRHGNLQAAAANRDADLKALRQQWKGYFPDGARRPDLMVTEYGTLNVNTPLFTARLSHVLYLADLVASQLENDVRVSISSNLNGDPLPDGSNNPQNLLGSTPDFLLTGRAKMLSLYSTMVGDTTITSGVTDNPIVRAPAGDYPTLRVVSSCSGATTRVMVLNRDPENTVTATVRLPHQHSAGRVRISTLNGPSVDSYNTPGNPDAITTSVTYERSPAGTLKHTFEPHSITLLEFTGNADRCSTT